MNNSVRAFEVFFKNVSPEAYERPSFGYQATNEIVQNLIQDGFIERDTVELIKQQRTRQMQRRLSMMIITQCHMAVKTFFDPNFCHTNYCLVRLPLCA